MTKHASLHLTKFLSSVDNQWSSKKTHFRVVIVGDSLATSWPNSKGNHWTDFLNQFLSEKALSSGIEIVNLGLEFLASYRQSEIAAKASKFNPDIIILMLGLDEFVEKRAYNILSPLRILQRHTYNEKNINNVIGYINCKFQYDFCLDSDLENDVINYYKEAASNSAASNGFDDIEMALTHFKLSTRTILNELKKANVPILVATLPINKWTLAPLPTDALHFKSISNQIRKAKIEIDNKDYLSARHFLQKALSLDSEYPLANFLLAHTFRMTEDKNRSKMLFEKAMKEDKRGLITHYMLNPILRELTLENRNSYLVDLESTFDFYAFGDYFSKEIFLDFKHPNALGNWLIASRLAKIIDYYNLIHFKEDSIRNFFELQNFVEATHSGLDDSYLKYFKNVFLNSKVSEKFGPQ